MKTSPWKRMSRICNSACDERSRKSSAITSFNVVEMLNCVHCIHKLKGDCWIDFLCNFFFCFSFWQSKNPFAKWMCLKYVIQQNGDHKILKISTLTSTQQTHERVHFLKRIYIRMWIDCFYPPNLLCKWWNWCAQHTT